MSDTPRTDAVARINEYLGVGGLFNPEILNVQQHEAVRDTLIQARDELNAMTRERDEAVASATLHREKFGASRMAYDVAERRNADLLARIQRLEEAGDALKAAGYFGGFGDAVNKWNKAKEAKP